jgi:hypothetical protein
MAAAARKYASGLERLHSINLVDRPGTNRRKPRIELLACHLVIAMYAHQRVLPTAEGVVGRYTQVGSLPMVRQQLTMSLATPTIRTTGKRRTLDSRLVRSSGTIRRVWPNAF